MIIFVFMFAFEVLKTIRDVVADSEAGYSTVATEWGTRATSLTFRISLAGYAALTLVPIAFGASAYYTALMWLGAVIPSCIVAWRCPIQNSPRAVRRVLLVMTICWIPGLAALSVAFRG
jgi:4-hydroxybenzoate polyprenyltransferase